MLNRPPSTPHSSYRLSAARPGRRLAPRPSGGRRIGLTSKGLQFISVLRRLEPRRIYCPRILVDEHCTSRCLTSPFGIRYGYARGNDKCDSEQFFRTCSTSPWVRIIERPAPVVAFTSIKRFTAPLLPSRSRGLALDLSTTSHPALS